MHEHLSAPKLNNTREQAAQMSCSVRHLQNLCNKRLVPFYKLGKSVRFDPVAVHKALQKLCIKER
jgi:excisionase family DNA binding protein